MWRHALHGHDQVEMKSLEWALLSVTGTLVRSVHLVTDTQKDTGVKGHRKPCPLQAHTQHLLLLETSR